MRGNRRELDYQRQEQIIHCNDRHQFYTGRDNEHIGKFNVGVPRDENQRGTDHGDNLKKWGKRKKPYKDKRASDNKASGKRTGDRAKFEHSVVECNAQEIRRTNPQKISNDRAHGLSPIDGDQNLAFEFSENGVEPGFLLLYTRRYG